jgi:hypothetical protein
MEFFCATIPGSGGIHLFIAFASFALDIKRIQAKVEADPPRAGRSLVTAG